MPPTRTFRHHSRVLGAASSHLGCDTGCEPRLPSFLHGRCGKTVSFPHGPTVSTVLGWASGSTGTFEREANGVDWEARPDEPALDRWRTRYVGGHTWWFVRTSSSVVAFGAHVGLQSVGRRKGRDERHQRDAGVRAGKPSTLHSSVPVRNLVRVPVRTPRR